MSQQLIRNTSIENAVDRKKRLWNLCSPDGPGLRPEAPLIVDAIMFRPNSVNGQIKRITARMKNAHRPDESELGKLEQENQENIRGFLAGVILLDLLRLDDAGYEPSLNSASLLLSEVWRWDDKSRDLLRGRNVGKHRSWHFNAWREFRPSAHLWAARLLAFIRVDSGARPLSPEIGANIPMSQLVEGLQIAAGLSVWASKIWLEDKKRRSRYAAMDENSTWKFVFPPNLRPDEHWVPEFPTLTDDEIRILDSYKVPKSPNSQK